MSHAWTVLDLQKRDSQQFLIGYVGYNPQIPTSKVIALFHQGPVDVYVWGSPGACAVPDVRHLLILWYFSRSKGPQSSCFRC